MLLPVSFYQEEKPIHISSLYSLRFEKIQFFSLAAKGIEIIQGSMKALFTNKNERKSNCQSKLDDNLGLVHIILIMKFRY